MVQRLMASGVRIGEETKVTISMLINAFSVLPDTMEDEGKSLLLSLISGIQSEIPALKDAANMTAQQIVSALRSYFELPAANEELKQAWSKLLSGFGIDFSGFETPAQTATYRKRDIVDEAVRTGRTTQEIIIELDGKALAKATLPYIENESRRIGVKLVTE